MFDINAINTLFNTAINGAVAQATVALTERVAQLEAVCQAQHEGMTAMRDRITALETQAAAAEAQLMAVRDRITALETKLTEAALFAQTNNVTIPVDEAKMVEALNSQEWFWDKIRNFVDAATEQAVDNHCETYDHDDYDSAVSKLDDLPDLDDYATRDELRSEIEDVLNNCSLSISI